MIFFRSVFSTFWLLWVELLNALDMLELWLNGAKIEHFYFSLHLIIFVRL